MWETGAFKKKKIHKKRDTRSFFLLTTNLINNLINKLFLDYFIFNNESIISSQNILKSTTITITNQNPFSFTRTDRLKNFKRKRSNTYLNERSLSLARSFIRRGLRESRE